MSPEARQLITTLVMADEFEQRSNDCHDTGHAAAADYAWQCFEQNRTEARKLAAEIIGNGCGR